MVPCFAYKICNHACVVNPLPWRVSHISSKQGLNHMTEVCYYPPLDVTGFLVFISLYTLSIYYVFLK